MALLLHLSDLHLGARGDEVFGDHKLEVIDPQQRETRTETLRSSLEMLGRSLQDAEEVLDAVVVSGDVTYQGDPDGLDALGSILDHLGDARPANSRIVVVPGNHDVRWDTDPSSRDRYQSFVDCVRDKGFVTPVLEGVDPDPTDPGDATLTAVDESFVVVALNSSNHCGVRQHVDGRDEHVVEEVERHGNDAARALLEMWRRDSLYDVARVDPVQRRHGSAALNAAVNSLTDKTKSPLRIAAFHHQLLPVSLDEEIKPFEALTNLAQVRDWIAQNQIDLVLHGHKHVARTYLDEYVPLSAAGPVHARRVMVSAVGTVGLGQGSENTIGRLVRVDPEHLRLGKVVFYEIPSTRPGNTMSLRDYSADRCLLRVDAPDGVEIAGESLAVVHEQIVERVEAGVLLTGPLVCRIATPPDTGATPWVLDALMHDEVENVKDWFKDTVNLWQREKRYSAMDFNHGERVLKYDGSIDLVEKVAEALHGDSGTSRGVISLINHSEDNIASQQQFPAFCLVQLFTTNDTLEVVGYFRKQEMLYWWPINVAELAKLQRDVRDKLAAKASGSMTLGKITTITAIPTTGKSIPRVVVPLLDRWVDDAPHRLNRMCMSLMGLDVDGESATADWEVMLEECKPRADAADGGPVPIAGMNMLMHELSELKKTVADAPDLTTIEAVLSGLVAQHEDYQQVTRRNDEDDELHERLMNSVNSLRAQLAAILPGLADGASA